MKRKFLLSLGAVAAFTPVIAVVACGKIQEPTSDQLDQYRKLTSSEATRILEEKWAEQVLTSQNVDFLTDLDATTGLHKLDASKSASLKDAVFYIIRNEVAKDKNYLNKIATNLLADRVAQWGSTDKTVDIAYLTTNGLAKIYNNGNIAATDVTADAMNILLNYTKSDFRLKVYKQLVVEAYLKTSRANYAKAFPKNARNFTLIQQDIEDANFVLINEALSQKLFAQWNVTLEKATSMAFYGRTLSDVTAVRNAIIADGTENGSTHELAAVALYSQKQVNEHEVEGIMPAASYGKMLGWKGFVNVAPVGTKTLSYTREELKKVTTSAGWEGVLQNDTITTTNIKFVDDKADAVNLTYVRGLLPIFAGNKFTFAGSNYANSTDQVARILAYKNTGLYKTASEFFRTKADGLTPIVLDVKQDDIKTILQDANFEFIKERTAE